MLMPIWTPIQITPKEAAHLMYLWIIITWSTSTLPNSTSKTKIRAFLNHSNNKTSMPMAQVTTQMPKTSKYCKLAITWCKIVIWLDRVIKLLMINNMKITTTVKKMKMIRIRKNTVIKIRILMIKTRRSTKMRIKCNKITCNSTKTSNNIMTKTEMFYNKMTIRVIHPQTTKRNSNSKNTTTMQMNSLTTNPKVNQV